MNKIDINNIELNKAEYEARVARDHVKSYDGNDHKELIRRLAVAKAAKDKLEKLLSTKQ